MAVAVDEAEVRGSFRVPHQANAQAFGLRLREKWEMQLEISHFVTTLCWVKHVHLCPEANKSVLNSPADSLHASQREWSLWRSFKFSPLFPRFCVSSEAEMRRREKKKNPFCVYALFPCFSLLINPAGLCLSAAQEALFSARQICKCTVTHSIPN